MMNTQGSARAPTAKKKKRKENRCASKKKISGTERKLKEASLKWKGENAEARHRWKNRNGEKRRHGNKRSPNSSYANVISSTGRDSGIQRTSHRSHLVLHPLGAPQSSFDGSQIELGKIYLTTNCLPGGIKVVVRFTKATEIEF